MPRKKTSARANTRRARALPAAPAAGSAAGRDSDTSRLHPEVRACVTRVLSRLAAAGIPFRVFEAFRSPQRQHYLWEQGRTRPGAKVTNAGGLYRSAENDWHLRCYGNHLDRTAQWYGDACAVLQEAGTRGAMRATSRGPRG